MNGNSHLPPAKGRGTTRVAASQTTRSLEAARIIGAAESERDRLLIRVLWVTGGRISEVLALTAGQIEPDALYLVNLKGGPAHKRVFLPAESDLPGRLLLWQKANGLADDEPLFTSRKGAGLSRLKKEPSARAESSPIGHDSSMSVSQS